MKIRSLADVKTHLSDYVRQAVKGPVVITRNGRPVAVLLAVDDQRLCTILGCESVSPQQSSSMGIETSDDAGTSAPTAAVAEAAARSPREEEGLPIIPDYLL